MIERGTKRAGDALGMLRGVSRVASIAMRADGALAGLSVGSVSVDASADRVTLREVRRVRARAGVVIDGKDATRWRVDGDRLEIAHLRLGEDRAVPIAAFRIHDLATGESAAESYEPHPCGPDVYHASLIVGDGFVRVRWRVATPRGDEFVVTRYR